MTGGATGEPTQRAVGAAGAQAVRLTDVFVLHRGAGEPVMALRGVDLRVEPGERLLVEGPNGSGKSTLLRTLTGDQQVSAGRVVIGGVDITDLPPRTRDRWRAGAIGYVDQHAGRALLPELTVLDNVALQLRVSGGSLISARTQAMTTLEAVGMQGVASRRIPSLSGGEAQRVAICAAVAHRPALLLADEPTGELDEDAARAVIDLIGTVADRGSAVLLVTHDPRSRRFSPRRIVIRDGRIAEDLHAPGQSDAARGSTPRVGTDGAHPVDSRGWMHIPPSTTGLDVPSPDRTRPLDDSPLVVLDAVSTTFPGRAPLPALTLTLTRGRWWAVTGPSGSGKTTLLHQICGLADPTSGSVSVDGTAWSGLDRRRRADHRRVACAVSTQRTLLVESLTATENLIQECAIRGVSPAGVGRLLADISLAAVADREAAVLSGGERQRLALARALVSAAPVLVLDEPTSQQDELSARRIAALLRTAVRAGRSVISSSHDPLLLAAADEVLDITSGTVTH